MAVVSGGKTVTTAGVAERLTDGPRGVLARIDVFALAANAGAVFIGDENVSSSRGWPLTVPGTVWSLHNVDPYDLYLDAANGGDGVSWGGVK